MARLYANENFPLPVVVELRRLGHDVLTIQETGRQNAALTDQKVLEAATSDLRAVLTLNRRHFVQLHLVDQRHCGIIVCTVDPDFIALAQRIADALEENQSIEGQLVRINRPTQP